MMNFFQKIWKRKILSALIIFVMVLVGYFGYEKLRGNGESTRYVTSAAMKGTLISSVSGSGQVSSLNQIDIKSKNSGTIVYLGAQKGQSVKAGALIAQIDLIDAQKSVRDAQANLEAAKISLAKLQQPANELSILQAQSALEQAKENKVNIEEDLVKSYADGLTKVANAFLDLPNVMSGLNDILLGNTFVANQWNIDYYANAVLPYGDLVIQYRQSAYNDYQAGRTAYNQAFADYKITTRFADNGTIEKLIIETHNSANLISEAVKSANNLLQFYKDKLTEQNLRPNAMADTHLASLISYTGKVNAIIADLFNIQKTIQADKNSIVSAGRSITEKTLSLANLQAGADSLDLQSQMLTIKQRENSLFDAQQKLADYCIRAPFDGVMASIDVSKGDTVSSSTSIATMITKQNMAEIPLNEVDIAKVKVGQKATFTFDAISDLTIAGTVSSVDMIGTVTQGVVNYNVKIVFDTQNDNVKPGMSTTAAIITEIKQDVVYVPNSAVKNSNNINYVQVLENGAPVNKNIEVGLTNDTNTEIVSGLNAGDSVITQTITSASVASSPAASNAARSSGSNIRIPGIGGFGR